MKRVLFLGTLLLFLVSFNIKSQDIPFLQKKEGHATCFVVDGKPMLLMAGEPLNSTGSYPARLNEVLAEMKTAHYNTALIAISWQMIEPSEGQFNFNCVDSLLAIAKKNNIKIGLLWFGAWKNGISPYAPSWVLGNTKRFERVRTQGGENTKTLSVFCDETKEGDAKAFASLMKYIAENDSERTVIMVQIENEIGVLGQTRDFGKKADKAIEENVPDQLLDYITSHRESLEIEILEKWKENGSKTSGTWTEIFGESSLTDLFFMAWNYSRYVNYVCGKGKEVYPLPMFVNCWMSQKRPQPIIPGKFPSGGPVLQVLDIWKAGAPNIDFLSPDIYDDQAFYIHTKNFHRSDNPLFIPEMHMQEGRATYVFAEYDAMGISPFGLDGHAGNITKEYEFLEMMMPVILENQGTRKMRGFIRWTPESESLEFKFDDDVTIVIDFNKRTHLTAGRNDKEQKLPPAYGLLILTSNNDFIVGGLNVYVSAKSTNPNKEVWLNNVREGIFDENGEWKQLGIRNGDEAGFLNFDTPHYSIGKYQGYYQGAVGSTIVPATFKFEVIKCDKK